MITLKGVYEYEFAAYVTSVVQSGMPCTIRESNQASVVHKAHYA